MATYYVELEGGDITHSVAFAGGDMTVATTFEGGDIYPTGGGSAILETKSVSYTPSETAISATVNPSSGYDGLEKVNVSVGAISSTYVGSAVPTQGATTYHPSTSDQTIASGRYLTGGQTFKKVTTSNLSAGNIKSGVTVKVGDTDDDDRIVSVVGTYSGGGANLTTKSVSYTPSTSAISDTLTPPTGYDGFSQVDVSVSAVPTASTPYISGATILSDGKIRADIEVDDEGYVIGSTYPSTTPSAVVTPRTSSDLSASGATVTAPSGYYASSATKTIANASSPQLSGVGVNNDGSVDVDLDISSGGYISATSTTLSAGYLNVQAAQTIHPSTSDQTIPTDYYLTGAQTIKGVLLTNLSAGNIKKDVVVEIGDSTDSDCVTSVTGTYEGGSTGWTSDGIANLSEPNGAITLSTATSVGAYAFYNRTGVTSVTSSSVTTIGNYGFQGCTGLTTLNMSSLTTINTYGVSGCTSLTTLSLPALNRVDSSGLRGNTSLEYFIMAGGASTGSHGDGVRAGSALNGCTSLIGADFKWKYYDGLGNMFGASTFSGCSSLNILILRSTKICSLANINVFSGTPFANGGTGGTVYIPKSLYDHLGDNTSSDYQKASNWTTINGYGTITWAKIEGSTYETHYVDGSTIPT